MKDKCKLLFKKELKVKKRLTKKNMTKNLRLSEELEKINIIWMKSFQN